MIYHLVAISLLIAISPSAAFPSEASNGDIGKMLSQTVVDFRLYGNGEFANICRQLSIACGEARYAADWDRQNKLPEKHMKGETLKAILDAIVLRYPGYQWRIYGKTAVLEPITRPRSWLLHKRIRKFEIRKGNLLNAPEQAAKAAGVEFLGAGAYAGGYSEKEDERIRRSYRRQIDVKLKNATLQEILCDIVATHGSSYWAYLHADRGDAFERNSISVMAY